MLTKPFYHSIKIQKMRFITFLLIPLLFLTGCHTIMLGHKQKIQVKSNEPNAKVYIDHEYVGETPLKVKVERHEAPLHISLAKEGYETTTIEVPTHRTRATSTLGNTWLGSVLTGPGGLGLALNIDDENPTMALSSYAIGFSLPFVIDIITSNKKAYDYLSSELTLPIYKKNKKVEDVTDLIFCSEVNINLKEGEKAGKITYNSYSRTIDWEKDIQFKDFELEKAVNESLEDLNFQVPDFESKNTLTPLKLPRYIITAEVTKFFNSVTTKYANADIYPIQSNIEVIWKVKLRRTNNTLMEKKISTKGFNISTDIRSVFENVFSQNFHEFLNTSSELYELTNKSVETSLEQKITIQKNIPISEEFEDLVNSVVTVNTEAGHGSGFAISEDGYIITNYHVIEDVDSLEVILSNDQKLEAKLINYNAQRDLALLKIDHVIKPLPISTDDVKLGTSVIAIGTPADITLGQTLSKGMISGKRTIEEKTFLQSDVSISPGNSGGPLIYNGKVIGVIDAKVVGQGVEGITFIIPADEILNALNITYSDIN
ncbi:trypsin-like peptidase domain-containing protein [Limibacter armeniacum]|uniref:trypsin-like peptidase domain-containing protein n=1 Tax=Limibacter armeniacum TaxID=466084 RepID=UPI002FE54DEF